MRYEGQSWELNVPICITRPFVKKDLQKAIDDFHDLHYQVYCYAEQREVVEFVNLRVRVTGKNPTVQLPRTEIDSAARPGAAKESRQVFFEGVGWSDVPVLEREPLPVGALLKGPCIIEEPISTTLIPPNLSGTIDEYRNIIIARDHGCGISMPFVEKG
jgi:N-methylhydantoinase A